MSRNGESDNRGRAALPLRAAPTVVFYKLISAFTVSIEFNRIYKRLDIRLEEKGESFYQDKMVQVVKDLKAAKLVRARPQPVLVSARRRAFI